MNRRHHSTVHPWRKLSVKKGAEVSASIQLRHERGVQRGENHEAMSHDQQACHLVRNLVGVDPVELNGTLVLLEKKSQDDAQTQLRLRVITTTEPGQSFSPKAAGETVKQAASSNELRATHASRPRPSTAVKRRQHLHSAQHCVSTFEKVWARACFRFSSLTSEVNISGPHITLGAKPPGNKRLGIFNRAAN